MNARSLVSFGVTLAALLAVLSGTSLAADGGKRPLSRAQLTHHSLQAPNKDPAGKAGVVFPMFRPAGKAGAIAPMFRPADKAGIVAPMFRPAERSGLIGPMFRPIGVRGAVGPSC